MRVVTENSQVFDFGLATKVTQENFTDEKYRALAGGSPAGLALQALVDEHWLEWLEIVEEAPWLQGWIRSPLYVKKTAQARAEDALEVEGTDRPTGEMVDGASRFYQRRIARAIYAEAVWGYGMADWLRGKHIVMGTDAKTLTNSALRTIYKLQNVLQPSSTRKYTWDENIYRGCGMLIPCEFGVLDRWLEPLWVEAQAIVRG